MYFLWTLFNCCLRRYTNNRALQIFFVMLLLSLGLPTVSLESAERPNYFLCVTPNRVVRLERWRPDEDFRRQATFIHHQGLWLPGRSSFELHSQKGVFITLTHTHARAQSYDNSYSFKASSSFTIEGMKVPINTITHM